MRCCGISPLRLAQETGCFALATVLSCGPSQAFGLVKFLFDAHLYRSVRSQIQTIAAGRISSQTNWEEFKASALAQQIAGKLLLSEEELTPETIQKYMDAKDRKREAKINRLYHSLKADLWALVPFLGAHISWRVATHYKEFSFTPFISRAVQQLFENCPKLASWVLFIDRNKKKEGEDKGKIKTLDVTTSTKKRKVKLIGAKFLFGRDFRQRKPKAAVVFFLGNAMKGEDMNNVNFVAPYREAGYDPYFLTMGGYDGDKTVKTSEKSFYQDIETVKQYLIKRGFTEVVYHGLSLECSAAIQAASFQSEQTENLKTLFVVADRPFTSASEVARNVAGPFGEGYFRSGLPKGIEIELPGGTWIQTDGLDNAEKMSQLKEKGIPLICFEADKDNLMGRKKVNGVYTENFAKDLLAKRYDTEDEQQKHLDTFPGDHYAAFQLTSERVIETFAKLLPATMSQIGH